MTDDCGCCATPPIDSEIENRPGLALIAYRSGTFATFRQALIQEIGRAPGLTDLTSRGSDDYTIAAIELWSAVADVLAFYQERTANESFLRTAVLRDSVLRLVRLLGYELAPGVSAQTWLAFTVERGATAMVPPRTRVKSVPVAKELPSTFETMEPLDADPTWNALEPFRLRRHVLRPGDASADFAGVTTGLSPGDVLVFAGKKKRHQPKSIHWDVARVRTVEPDPKRQRTRVTWWPPLGSESGRRFPTRAHVYVLRQRAAVFGHNAPDWHLLSDTGKAALLGLRSADDVTDDDRAEWPQFEIYGPIDPNKPRTWGPPGRLTIQPTVESVVAAALEAAKSAKEAVIAETATAAANVPIALAKVVAAANDASSELTRLVINEGGKQVSAAIGNLGSLEAAIVALQAAAQGLGSAIGTALDVYDGTVALDPGGAIRGAALRAAGNGMRSAANTLVTDLNNLPTDMSGSALKALNDLLKTFKHVAEQGGFTSPRVAGIPQIPLVDKLLLVADAAKAAADAVKAAIACAFYPLGATACERTLQVAVKTVLDHQNLLDNLPVPLSAPQRIGVVAVLAAEFASFAMDPAEDLRELGESATGAPTSNAVWLVINMGGAAGTVVGAFTTAGLAVFAGFTVVGLTTAVLGTGGVVPLVASMLATGLLAPLIAGALIGAITVGQQAHPGARRVADAVRKSVLIALQPQHPAAPARYLPRTLHHNRVDLETVYPRMVGGSWVLLSSPLRDELYRAAEVDQTSRTDYALTGAVTRLKLKGNGLAPDANGHNPYFHVRETAVFGESEELTLALDTISDPFSGTTIDVAGVPGDVAAGRTLLIAGTDAATGEPASDLVTFVSQAPAPPPAAGVEHTIVTFEPEVTRRYALDGLVMYGNVAHATNGETVRNEIVGDGDASQGFQKFALRKKPVTYVLDRKTGIVNSSLTLLVNSVKWDEVPTLYGRAAADPVYTARIADDTTMTLTFGDGVTGSRLPTGRQNVIAQYRQGIGAEANVGAQRITNLVDRPKGLRAATNPSRAEGGVDPETLAGARVAAPGTVRTFGRAVSLRDFEDSALFNGIVAKASATWVWTGERRAIHLTVAAAGGAILSDDVTKQLRIRLDDVRDVNQRLLIDNYVRVPIVIDARLTVDDRHVAADVLAAARAALLATFAFESRGFGQPVFLSDIFSLLQHVAGVVAVDVNRLDLKSGNAAFRAAHGVDDTLGQPQPRLLMLPARPDAATGTVHPAELAVIEADNDLTLSATGGIAL